MHTGVRQVMSASRRTAEDRHYVRPTYRRYIRSGVWYQFSYIHFSLGHLRTNIMAFQCRLLYRSVMVAVRLCPLFTTLEPSRVVVSGGCMSTFHQIIRELTLYPSNIDCFGLEWWNVGFVCLSYYKHQINKTFTSKLSSQPYQSKSLRQIVASGRPHPLLDLPM